MLQDDKERELRNVIVARAEPAQLPSISYLAAWYATVITVQVLLALMPVLKTDIHWWRLSPSGNWLSGIYLAAASIVGTGLALAIRPKVPWQRLLLLVSTVAEITTSLIGPRRSSGATASRCISSPPNPNPVRKWA